MNDYISRKALLDWVHEFYSEDKVFASAIINAPAADVAPVLHGRWIWRNKWEPFEFKYECSICHDGSDLESKYCPHFGTNMDLGRG